MTDIHFDDSLADREIEADHDAWASGNNPIALSNTEPVDATAALETVKFMTPIIHPDATASDAVTSSLVCIVTEPSAVAEVEFSAVATPMVRRVNVTVTLLLAGIVAVAVVMTIFVLVGVAAVPVAPPPLIATPGVPVLEKKPDGYVSVMVLPLASSPPAVVVNDTVAAAEVLPATRSDAAIENEGLVTWPPITPELTPADAV